MKIKICGLTRMEDILAVNQYVPDYIGFVFAKSRRQVNRDRASRMKEKLNLSIQAVGVFVDDSISNIVSLCKDGIIDVVQLHGEEGEEYIKELQNLLPNPIIKAVRIRYHSTIETIRNSSADYLLLDAYHPEQYGGSGQTFDWNLAASMESILTKPYFLAGGIGYGNIEEAVRVGNPYCIDISSGVETDGCKDPVKIKAIIEKIRRV